MPILRGEGQGGNGEGGGSRVTAESVALAVLFESGGLHQTPFVLDLVFVLVLV